MGLPTIAAHIVVAVLAVLALTQMGAHLFQAYFFVLYLSILSGLTLPVALAALVGAKVAQADYIKTSWVSIQYGLIAFIIPFLFAFSPALMALSSPMDILWTSIATLLGFMATSFIYAMPFFKKYEYK